MSRKYPYQCAAKNIRINQERLRSRHTDAYADVHKQREAAERIQTLRAEAQARDPEGYARRVQAFEEREKAAGRNADSTAPQALGAGATASASALAGAGSAALGGVAVLLASGTGTAFVLNKTVLKDDPAASEPERAARKAGRAGSYAGGLAGTGATVAMVSSAGAVSGLSGAGIAAGLATVGASVGGGVAAGVALAVAAPAALAAAAGYGVYRLVRGKK